MKKLKPWSKKERDEIMEVCKGASDSFDIGNIRWEITVRKLEEQLSDALSDNPMVQELKDTIAQCRALIATAKQGGHDPKVSHLLNRAASNLDKLFSKLSYKP